MPPVSAPARTATRCLLLGSLLPPQNAKSFSPPLPGIPFLHVTARLTPQKSWVSDQTPRLEDFPDSGREDPLEKGIATHSTILAWEIEQTEKPGRL